jgi:hypothetical protein
MATAVLGALIFNERLPKLWWLGAAMLVAGSVIIGMREETEKKDVAASTGEAPLLDRHGGANVEDEREEVVELSGLRNRESYSNDESEVLK